MFVVSNISFDGCHPDTGDVDIPAIQIVSFGYGRKNTRVNSVGVDNLQFREPYPLFEAR